jgi:hypothetical protein
MVGVSYGRPVSDLPTDDAPRRRTRRRRLAVWLALVLGVFAVLYFARLGLAVDPSVLCQRPDGTTYSQFGTSCVAPDVKLGT